MLRLLPFALAALAVLLVPLPAESTPQAREITIDSAQYEFNPSRIEVNHGDHVTIRFTASDVVHGFYLDGYGIERRVEPGLTEEITFTADQPGKFRYRCSVTCGAMHPFMIGELVVTPNFPFWRAAGFVAIALAGMLFNLWHGLNKNVLSKESENGYS